ncbi:MAG: 3-hydroxyacyl-CoA dehydrogenase family protein, partial [Promethearchaeota archaeon]
MNLEDINRVAVIGAGLMGSQIAELLSRVGEYSVTIVDLNSELVNRALSTIRSRLKRYFVDRGKMSQTDMEGIVARIEGVTSIAGAAENADFIVEAIVENSEVKCKVFKQLDRSAPSTSILSSNTSGLS